MRVIATAAAGALCMLLIYAAIAIMIVVGAITLLCLTGCSVTTPPDFAGHSGHMLIGLVIGLGVAGYLYESARVQRLTFRKILVAVFVVLFMLLATGCDLLPTRTVVKTETVEVPKYQRAPLPKKLVQPCTYVEPDPACWRADQNGNGHREFCNEQLNEIKLGYRNALGECDADKTQLRSLGPVNDDG